MKRVGLVEELVQLNPEEPGPTESVIFTIPCFPLDRAVDDVQDTSK